MSKIFPQSRNLKQVIERQGLTLYDTTLPAARRDPHTWDEIEMKEPAPFYETSHSYMLLPPHQKGKRLRDLVHQARAEGFFPVLRMPQYQRRFNIVVSDGYFEQNAVYYLLNELHFQRDYVLTLAHPCIYPPYSSRVGIYYQDLVEVFREYFTQVQFTEAGPKFKKTLMGAAN